MSNIFPTPGKSTPGTVLEGYTYLGLNTIVEESHPQTGVDLTYITQAGDTSAPPAYAATGGDRYVGLDQFGRVDDQFYVNPGSVTSPTDRFQYSFDQDGNPLYKDVTEMGGTAATFSQLYHASAGLDSAAFDGQDRLANFEQGTLSHTNASNGSGVLDTVASPLATQALTLDSLGNWQTSAVTGAGTSEQRTFNAQNQITNNSGSYSYTAWNQMAGASAGGQQYAFTYLPNGPQASISLACCGNTSTFSFYSTQWQDLEDVPPSGGATTYVWGLENVNELVARDDSAGNRLYAQHDANMDVTALVNTSGSVVERFSYSPFGVATVLSPSWSATTDSYNWIFRWQGGRYNAATGLYTFGFRNYSPTLATWMEEDPTGYAAGPNVYQAMLGEPIAKTDPYGLDAAAGQTGGAVNSGGAAQPTSAPDPNIYDPGPAVVPGSGPSTMVPGAAPGGTYYPGDGGDSRQIWWEAPYDPDHFPDWENAPPAPGWRNFQNGRGGTGGGRLRIDIPIPKAKPPKTARKPRPAPATDQPQPPAGGQGNPQAPGNPGQPPNNQAAQGPGAGPGDGIVYVPVDELPPEIMPDPELPSGSSSQPWQDSAGWVHTQLPDGTWLDVWVPFGPISDLPNGGLVTSQTPTPTPTTRPR